MIKGKKADGETITHPLIMLFAGVVVVVIIVFAIFFFDVPQKIRDAFPGFGGGDNELYPNGDNVINSKNVIKLKFDYKDVNQENDFFYFIWDNSIKRLKIAFSFKIDDSNNFEGWYLDQNQLTYFKNYVRDSTKAHVNLIMDSKDLEEASQKIAELSLDKNVISYVGSYLDGKYVDDQESLRDPITKEDVKELLEK